jgi:RNA polymerase sigma factor (TIGR02999 family)
MDPEHSAPPVELTRLLQAWSGGDASALEQLTPFVYAELHRLARSHLFREREGHLLQPSALVNEAFLRLVAGATLAWSNRAHFFAFSARLMRQILIDFAGAQETTKRGQRSPHLDVSSIRNLHQNNPDPVPLIDLETALNELAAIDPRPAQIVELVTSAAWKMPKSPRC